MADRPVKIDVNVSTGERTVTPLTDEEIATMELEAQAFEVEKQAQLEAQAQKEADKASAISKLTALGLTEDEALALVGA